MLTRHGSRLRAILVPRVRTAWPSIGAIALAVVLAHSGVLHLDATPVLAQHYQSLLGPGDWPRTIGMLQLMLAGGLCFRRTRISAAVALAAIVMIAIANQWRNDRIDAQSSLQAAVCAWALIVAWGEARRARALAPG